MLLNHIFLLGNSENVVDNFIELLPEYQQLVRIIEYAKDDMPTHEHKKS